MLRIEGASDDLIDIHDDETGQGDELNPGFGGPAMVAASDGTLVLFTYSGIWRADVRHEGGAFVRVIPGSHDTDRNDVVELRSGVRWVALVKGNELFQQPAPRHREGG